MSLRLRSPGDSPSPAGPRSSTRARRPRAGAAASARCPSAAGCRPSPGRRPAR